MNKDKLFARGLWALGAVTILLAVVVWADQRLNGGNFSAYTLFPVLGLSAFSLMWTHYVWGGVKRIFNLKISVKGYMSLTRTLVFALILMHPGILLFSLWVDGFGLPPGSYEQVYPLGYMKFAIFLGLVSLVIFMSFELKRFIDKKSYWKYVEYANSVAMLLIFYHALQLGGELAVGWYKAIWYFYGVTLLGSLGVIYCYHRSSKGENYEKSSSNYNHHLSSRRRSLRPNR